MSYHKLMLENQTIFTKMVFEKLTEENLTVGQPKVLEYLINNDGAVQKDIAKACLIEPATLTSLLSRMEKSGLIERKNKNGDKRYLCVCLTKAGRKSGERVIKELNALESTALQNFSQNEKEQFIAFLTRVNSNLNEKRSKDN